MGGGVIGLTTAFCLARAGVSVTLFDPALARGATWASAGMIAPTAEITAGEELHFRQQRRALAAWRELGDAMHQCIGERVDLHQTGSLLVGWDAGDRRYVEQFIQTASSFGASVRRVLREECPDLFVGVTPRISDGVMMPEDAWLDPDHVVVLLRRALHHLGVDVVEQEVVRVDDVDAGVVAWTSDQKYSARHGIFATGAARLPAGVRGADETAVRPVRGITVRVRAADRGPAPMVRSWVRGRPFYYLSRPGGYGVLGATMDEHATTFVEVGELQRLLRDGRDLVPELEAASFDEVRSGLRPATGDLAPFFIPLLPTAWAWSSGHYRHGVTLAPLAALRALEFVRSGE